MAQMPPAPPSGGRPSSMRPGDWMCPSCNNHNYADKIRCNRCKMPKPEVYDPQGMQRMMQGMAGMMSGMQSMQGMSVARVELRAECQETNF